MTSNTLEMGDIIEKNPLGAFQKLVMFLNIRLNQEATLL